MATKLPQGIRRRGTGLEIRLQHRGKKYSQTITCNSEDASSIAAALRARNELRRQLRQGTLHPRDEDHGNVNFAKAAQSYIDSMDLEYSTALTYISILNTHWIPEFKDWHLGDIRASQVKTYIHKQDLSSKTKSNLLVPLRGVFIWAIEDGLLNDHPVLHIRSKKRQKPTIKIFTLAERARILSCLEEHGQAFIYFALLFGTGMRVGEALGLKWENIFAETIHVDKSVVRGRLKQTTKTLQSRDVYVEPWLQKILREHHTRFSGEWLFVTDDGKPYTSAKTFNLAWGNALAQAGVPYRIPYTCRHSRASELLTMGVKPPFAALQLGHSVEMFFRTYAVWIKGQDDCTEISKLNINYDKYGVSK